MNIIGIIQRLLSVGNVVETCKYRNSQYLVYRLDATKRSGSAFHVPPKGVAPASSFIQTRPQR